MSESRTNASSHRGLSISVASQAWAAVAALIAFPLLARGLGVVDRGRFALVLAVSEIGTLLFKMGLPEAAAFCDKEHLANQRSILRQVRKTSYWLTPVSVAAGVGAYALILENYPTDLRIIGSLLVALSPLIDTVNLSRVRLMISRGDARGIALNTALPNSVLVVGLVALELVDKITLHGAVIVSICATLTGYLVSVWRIRTRGQSVDDRVPQLIRFASHTAPYSVMEAVNLRLDQIVLPIVAGPAELGVYAVATSITAPISRVGLAASASFYSGIRLSSADSGATDASLAFRRSSVLILIASALAMLLAPPAIYLLAGHQYHDAIALTVVLSVAWCLFAMAVVAANILGALGRPGDASGSQAVGLVITVVLLVPAIKEFGALGAAFTSLLSYFVRLFYCWRALKRRGVSALWPERSDVAWIIDPVRTMASKLVHR